MYPEVWENFSMSVTLAQSTWAFTLTFTKVGHYEYVSIGFQKHSIWILRKILSMIHMKFQNIQTHYLFEAK